MIIGLTGYKGAGKSTLAQQLVERHGFAVRKIAGPLKDMLRSLHLNEREIAGDLKACTSMQVGRLAREEISDHQLRRAIKAADLRAGDLRLS